MIRLKNKKYIALLLVAALLMTSMPNIVSMTAVAAKKAWSVLSEKDLVIDEVYDRMDDVLIGRKEGKIACVDKNLKLLNKTEYDQIENHGLGDALLVSRQIDQNNEEYALMSTKTGQINVLGTYGRVRPFFATEQGEKYFQAGEKETFGIINEQGELIVPMELSDVLIGKNSEGYFLICEKQKKDLAYRAVFDLRKKEYRTQYDYTDIQEISASEWLFATKENGTSGFLKQGEEVGFDSAFSGKSGVICADMLTVGTTDYYVKEYFENEDVKDDVSTIDQGISPEELQEKLAAEQCEFVFYDEKGKVVAGSKVVQDMQKKIQETETTKEKIKEKAGQLPIKEYVNALWQNKGIEIEEISVDSFGKGYRATVTAAVDIIDQYGDYDTQTIFYAGVYDADGNLQKSGLQLAEDEDEESLLILREKSKKIYLISSGGTEKYLYTDTADEFTIMEDNNSINSFEVELHGDEKVLVADPQGTFVKVARSVFSTFGSKDENANEALLLEEVDSRELVFYDYDWKVINRIDLSYLEDDYRYEVLEDDRSALVFFDYGMVFRDEHSYVLIDVDGGEYKVSLEEFPEFRDVTDVHTTISGKHYASIKTSDAIMVYQLDNRAKLFEIQGGNIDLSCPVEFADGLTLFEYTVEEEGESYCGLMNLQGEIVVDAAKMGYVNHWTTEYMSERLQSAVFADREGNYFYYYEKDLIRHSGDDWDDFCSVSRVTYDDITFLKNYPNDGNIACKETIYDMDGKVLATHTMTEQQSQEEGFKSFLYVFESCRSIIKVDQHWNGKRDSDPDRTPTPTPTPTLTPTPIPIVPQLEGPTSSPVQNPTAAVTLPPDDTQVVSASKPRLKKAAIKSAKNKKGKKAVIRWKKVKGAAGYQITYATNKKFKKRKTRNVAKTTVTLKKLKKKKTYYIKVRAYSIVDGKKGYGKWSKVKKIKIRK